MRKKVIIVFGFLVALTGGYLAGYQASVKPMKRYEAAYEQCMYLNNSCNKTVAGVCDNATFISEQVRKFVPSYPIYHCVAKKNPFDSSSTISDPESASPGYLP